MYTKTINEKINEKDRKNPFHPDRGGNRPKGCRFPGGQRAYKYRAPFSLSDRLPIATIGEAPLACPNTQIQRLRTREEIEMEGLKDQGMIQPILNCGSI